MRITKKRASSQKVSKEQMLFWLGVLINQAEQERNSRNVRQAPTISFKTAEETQRRALEEERLKAEVARIQAEAARAEAEADKAEAEADRARAEAARAKAEEARAKADEARIMAEAPAADKPETKRSKRIEVGNFIVAALSLIISFYTGLIAPSSAQANQYIAPTTISEPYDKPGRNDNPGWLERLLRFVAPVVLRVESRLVQAETALLNGADPNLVRDQLIFDLKAVNDEAAAAPMITFRDKFSRELEAQRLNAMTDLFKFNVSSDNYVVNI